MAMNINKMMNFANVVMGKNQSTGNPALDLVAKGARNFFNAHQQQAARPMPPHTVALPAISAANLPPGAKPPGFGGTANNQDAAPGFGAPVADYLDPDEWAIVRVMVAAAQSDGRVTSAEQELILQHARQLGGNDAQLEQLKTEFSQPVPVSNIVKSVDSIAARKFMYQCAVAICKTDQDVNEGERNFLTQLADATELSYDVLARLVI